jgi:type III pantothenate kinase
MAILLVDIGNTRIKWARLDAGRVAHSHAAAHAGWTARDYARRVIGSGSGLTRALIASVAGDRVDRALGTAARRAGIRCEFLSVPRRGGEITVGYLEPWRFGVDRFAAAVGAHHLFPGVPLWVVGVGTAMTLDLIGAEGTHHGGVIVPAPALMVETLLERTAGIRRRAAGGPSASTGLLARATRAAIQQGARYAAAALIDRAVTEGRALLGKAPFVVLTGGESAAVRSLLESRAAGIPDLVLKGLAVLALQERKPPRRRR